MDSYTFGSPEGVQAAVDEMWGHFPLRLNADDFEAVLRALAYTCNTLDCTEEPDLVNVHDHESNGDCLDTCWKQRAGSIASNLAERVGVEWV